MYIIDWTNLILTNTAINNQHTFIVISFAFMYIIMLLFSILLIHPSFVSPTKFIYATCLYIDTINLYKIEI